jgi:hypothetical protein
MKKGFWKFNIGGETWTIIGTKKYAKETAKKIAKDLGAGQPVPIN